MPQRTPAPGEERKYSVRPFKRKVFSLPNNENIRPRQLPFGHSVNEGQLEGTLVTLLPTTVEIVWS